MKNKNKIFCKIPAVLLAAALIFAAACKDAETTNSKGPPYTVNIAEIRYIYPVIGEQPRFSIPETEQYIGKITWDPPILDIYNSPSFSGTFDINTTYTATITLSIKPNYTIQGVPENFFKVEGAIATNAANSGVITAVFPETPDYIIDIARLERYLTNLPSNTADNPYTITLNLASFGYNGQAYNSNMINTLDQVLKRKKRYVILDLSDSTFTNIPERAFYNNYGGITNMGKDIYLSYENGNDYLVGITIGGNVKTIGNYAFDDCENLTGVTILDSVESIGNGAFRFCVNLSSVSIGNSLESIGEGAFFGCASLTGIIIPDSVTKIDRNAFSGCTSLSNVTIGKGVTSIEYQTFSGCTSLTDIIIPDNVTRIKTYTNDGSSYGAFSGCKKLANITIGKGVTVIEICAFSNCVGLVNITIPDSVTSIETSAFSNCVGLVNITIPDSVTSIETSAFFGCASLVNINIPDSVESIGYGAFSGCTSLTGITIPNKVTSIGNYTFEECASLVSATLSNNITSIGDSAFKGCTSLIDITLPNSITSIGDSAFKDCTSLIGITLPNSITSIGSEVFFSCTSLTSVTLPNNITNVGSYLTFRNCTSLNGIIIPDSVTDISYMTFSGCTSLTGINIPKNVTNIDGSAFSNCSKLTAITVDDNNSAYTVQDGVLYSKDMSVLILYPGGKTGDFKIPESVKTIGTYAFTNNYLTNITIPNTITTIEVNAFSYCSSLISVTFERNFGYYGFSSSLSSRISTFPGDLGERYFLHDGGIGTYTRTKSSSKWTKQS
ncbi:leucine-rich repeat [Treponema sp. R8-4-B8]